ncbi:hypothetical protein VE03_09971 [Pseudogymnoascus sp. 23342-1-I1]|nr:hypothetical protein VE03_09971 [Pseudogymnoascus sp. 23342-1-I1]
MAQQPFDNLYHGTACDNVMFQPRAYQLEMLEASRKGNIIVAMDTGSGKTQIALLRIMEEIEKGLERKVIVSLLPSPALLFQNLTALSKRIWFLAPTVALCTQHYENMYLQMPAVSIRLLLGSDNVDRWSDQRIWDAALLDIKVVISTHAVLADALTHSFFKIEELKLIIYDEGKVVAAPLHYNIAHATAHWCTRKHPANQIMRDFYHPTLKSKGLQAVPSILGLSASPSKPNGLEMIEANLNAFVRTPRVNRQEMLRYVHRPKLHKIEFLPIFASDGFVKSRALQMLYQTYPSICSLPSPAITTLEGAFSDLKISNQVPYKSEYIRKLFAKTCHVYEELGSWAADYFILESIKRLKTSAHEEARMRMGPADLEKGSLLKDFVGILEAEPPIDLTISADYHSRFSPKVECLIKFLVTEEKPGFSGLIFVQQRAVVGVLSQILSVHPETMNRFKCASFVGLSNNANGKLVVGDLTDTAAQSQALNEFRQGCKNLIVTTDALEEGIDIPACHFVVSYNNLPTLKSFVQRRGRARQRESLFGIMVPQNDQVAFDVWQHLEEEMVAAYQSEFRPSQVTPDLNCAEGDHNVDDILRVPSTDAFMTADSALAHLYHFCDKLPRQPYVDLRPKFVFEDLDGLIRATVYLPNCLNATVREKTGLKFWQSERAAAKDAALQAYKILYNTGLVNDNLLPLFHNEELDDEATEDLPSIASVLAQCNPWIGLAKAWSSQDLYEVKVSARALNDPIKTNVLMSLILPSAVPHLQPFNLYQNRNSGFRISLQEAKSISTLQTNTLQLSRAVTELLLCSTHTNNQPSSKTDFVALLVPNTDSKQLTTWLDTYRGSQSAVEVLTPEHEMSSIGLLRSALLQNVPHVLHHCDPATSEHAEERMVICTPLPKRRNFLHTPMPNALPGNQKATEVTPHSSRFASLPISSCTFDRLPVDLALFSLFIPTILAKLEVVLIATQLSQTIIKNVKLKELDHIITAISAPSAQWTSNYERYEFLGDSLLKFVVSTQLYADHPNWHEGYLSVRRNGLVCNTRLAKAAVDTGLDAYILTTPLLTRKWVARTISDMLVDSSAPRELSRKILADVVEALIGAAFLDHGLAAAQSCKTCYGTKNLGAAEELIGHKFRDRYIFLEALTHPSCQRDEFTESYQRLEFLGDAVLDMIVASALFADDANLSQGKMTQIKTALVNAQFLAYLAMQLTLTQDTVDVYEPVFGVFQEKHGTKNLHLWQLMRHESREVTKAQQECLERYHSLRVDIHFSLSQGKAYPWVLLTRLNADKFFSDLIEAVFGAIFIDSQGDLAECIKFAKRLGLLDYLRRIAHNNDEVDVTHPKNVVGHLAKSQKVNYVTGYRDGDDETGFFCRVSVGDTVIAAVGGCATRDEATVTAAEKAADVLKM